MQDISGKRPGRNGDRKGFIDQDQPSGSCCDHALPRCLNGLEEPDSGTIVGIGTAEHFFENPQEDRTKLFLSQIL